MKLLFPGGLDSISFLHDYWQQRPLLIPGAIPDYRAPLDPDELAGLACDPDIESRIVLEKDGKGPWEARLGPFDEEEFSSLPPSHWTLLVQDVDKHIPDVARLLDTFSFIPDWRLDDVMISYAADQGSVGPHIDDYDVFLLQVAGRRRWQIHTRPVSEEDYIPGLDLRILPDFEPEQEWVLEPGDMLYLPPNVAHWGIAEGDGCITCSVGFRTPEFREMVSSWCHELVQDQVPAGRYRDADLTPQLHKGEITPASLEHIGRQLSELLHQDSDKQARWFGRLITESKAHLQVYPRDDSLTADQFARQFCLHGRLDHNGWSRFAFIRGKHGLDYLYVNGDEYPVPESEEPFLGWITDHRQLYYVDAEQRLNHGEWLRLLTRLYNQGHLCFPDE